MLKNNPYNYWYMFQNRGTNRCLCEWYWAGQISQELLPHSLAFPRHCMRGEELWFLCLNTGVIDIGSTRSTTTFWFVLDVSQTSRSGEKLYFLTRHLQSNHHLVLAVIKEMAAKASFIKKPNKLFHSPGDTLPPKIRKNYNKAEKNKDTSMEARKLAEKRKRETEVEENRQKHLTWGRV